MSFRSRTSSSHAKPFHLDYPRNLCLFAKLYQNLVNGLPRAKSSALHLQSGRLQRHSCDAGPDGMPSAFALRPLSTGIGQLDRPRNFYSETVINDPRVRRKLREAKDLHIGYGRGEQQVDISTRSGVMSSKFRDSIAASSVCSVYLDATDLCVARHLGSSIVISTQALANAERVCFQKIQLET